MSFEKTPISKIFNQHQIKPALLTVSDDILDTKPISTQYETKILRINQVLDIYPVGRSTLYAMMKNGTFPANISLGGPRSVGWRSTDVFNFIANLEVK